MPDVNFDTYRILQQHCAVFCYSTAFFVCRLQSNSLSKSDKYRTRKNQSDRIFNADMTPPLFHLNFSDVPVGPDHPYWDQSEHVRCNAMQP